MSAPRTHYDALGVARHATHDEIRAAHRRLARMLHPDHLAQVRLDPADRIRAERRIREINEAWHVLGDRQRRSRYDRTLSPAPPEWTPPWTAPSPTPRRPKPRPRPPSLVVPWLPLLIGGALVLLVALVLALVVGPSPSTP